MFRRPIPSWPALRFAIVAPAVLAIAVPALAGPPLLCHPFDIGAAQSLPWDGTRSWRGGLSDYQLARLVADTEALLAPSTPVIVRMETLRRAAIYASRDPQVATSLFTRLTERARAAEQAGKADALAYLDAAYYVEALREISELSQVAEFKESAPMLRALVRGIDGYTLATRSLAARPGDPVIEFAAALIASDRHRDAVLGARREGTSGREPGCAPGAQHRQGSVARGRGWFCRKETTPDQQRFRLRPVRGSARRRPPPDRTRWQEEVRARHA